MKTIFTILFFAVTILSYSQPSIENSLWDIRLIKKSDNTVSLPKDVLGNAAASLPFHLKSANNNKTGVWLNTSITGYTLNTSGQTITIHSSSGTVIVHYEIKESYLLHLCTNDQIGGQTDYYGIYKPL